MSLRLRLAMGIAIVMFVALGVLGLTVVESTRSDLLAGARVQLEQSLSNRVRTNPPPREGPIDSADPRRLATAHLVVAVDDQIVSSDPAGPPSDPLPLPVLSTDDISSLRKGNSVTVDSQDGRIHYLVLAVSRPGGRLEVEAAPLDFVDATMDALVRRLLIGAGLTLLVAIAAVIIVVRHGLRPLRDVIDTADAVAAGEREQRIATDAGPTEIRQLSVALDRMLQQQRAALLEREESEARLRRFVADASHELQTPITSVLGWTQLQRKGALDAEGEAAAMARIESESRRMSVLVDDLLLLARLDEHRAVHVQPTDLAIIAHEAVADARAVEPSRPLICTAQSPVIVVGDPARLRQVLDNLLRNVRTHTPVGTPAQVTVTANSTHAEIVVEDEGPGIAPEHLAIVFDRFWRSDRSRTRATGGAGLGLSIVAALVEVHDGSITAANRVGGGAEFRVRIPLAQ